MLAGVAPASWISLAPHFGRARIALGLRSGRAHLGQRLVMRIRVRAANARHLLTRADAHRAQLALRDGQLHLARAAVRKHGRYSL